MKFLINKYIYIFSFAAIFAAVTAQAKDYSSKQLDVDSLLSFKSNPNVERGYLDKNLLPYNDILKREGDFGKSDMDVQKLLSFKVKINKEPLEKKDVLNNGADLKNSKLDKESLISSLSKSIPNEKQTSLKESSDTKVSSDKDINLSNKNKTKKDLAKVNSKGTVLTKNDILDVSAKKNKTNLSSSLLGYKNKPSSIKKDNIAKEALIKLRNLGAKKHNYVELSYKEKLESLERQVFLLEKEKEGLRQRLRFIEGSNIATLTSNNF